MAVRPGIEPEPPAQQTGALPARLANQADRFTQKTVSLKLIIKLQRRKLIIAVINKINNSLGLQLQDLKWAKIDYVSRVFTDLLSNSPKRSPWCLPGYEGREKMLYFLNSSQKANSNSSKLSHPHMISME